MRLGKCCQTIKALDAIEAETVLIICPATARETWRREFLKWGDVPREIIVLFSGVKPKAGAVNIASFEGAADKINVDLMDMIYEALELLVFDALVIDEAHFLKTTTTGRTKAVYGWQNQAGLAHHAKRVWLLTGTPSPNDPSELYPHCRTLFSDGFRKADGKLMNRTDFIERFCTLKNNGFGRKITGGRNLGELKQRLEPYVLRRTQAQVWPERKDPVIENLYLDAAKQLRALQTTEELDLMIELSDRLVKAKDEKARQRILDSIDDSVKMRLRRLLGLAKVEPLAAWVKDQLASGLDKIVLFAHHRDVLHGLRKYLAPVSQIAYIDGSTIATSRDAEAQRFQNDPKCKVFIGQLTAAGTGIDLSAANELVFAEYGWVPGDNDQASQRIQNINKKIPILIRYAVVSASLDERIAGVVRQKSAVIDQIFN
jgi:SNF2 family DNA or RNA helicase